MQPQENDLDKDSNNSGFKMSADSPAEMSAEAIMTNTEDSSENRAAHV